MRDLRCPLSLVGHPASRLGSASDFWGAQTGNLRSAAELSATFRRIAMRTPNFWCSSRKDPGTEN
jgi:hypothetical protein